MALKCPVESLMQAVDSPADPFDGAQQQRSLLLHAGLGRECFSGVCGRKSRIEPARQAPACCRS